MPIIAREAYQDHAKKVFTHLSHGEIIYTDDKKKGGIKTLFPEKLHKFLCSETCSSEYSEIGWAPHGRCFIVRDPEKFINDVTPLIFNHSTMASFQRQLNLYGFKRITKSGSRDEGAYYHEMFLRGRPDLCLLMRRKKIKGTQARPLHIPTDEPDFYAMDPCNGNEHDHQHESATSSSAQQVSEMMSHNHSIAGLSNFSLNPGNVSLDSFNGIFNNSFPMDVNNTLQNELVMDLIRRKYQNTRPQLTVSTNGLADANILSRLYDVEILRQLQARSLLERVGHRAPLQNAANPILANLLSRRLQGQGNPLLSPISMFSTIPQELQQQAGNINLNLTPDVRSQMNSFVDEQQTTSISALYSQYLEKSRQN